MSKESKNSPAQKVFKLRASQRLPITDVIKNAFSPYFQQIAVEEGIDPRSLTFNIDIALFGTEMPTNGIDEKPTVTPSGKPLENLKKKNHVPDKV